MKEKILRLGLIGKDVSKSDSERIHTFILKEWGVRCEYERFSVDADGADAALQRLLHEFDGFNVTIPYKRTVTRYLRTIEGDARACGAVNTVLANGARGYNTDGIGFMLMLRAHGISADGKRTLVLGGGGSGRSTAAALKAHGADVYVYRRDTEKLNALCAELGVRAAKSAETGDYDLLINCTGVGMHDTEGTSPVTAAAFLGVKYAVDLIYTPTQSEFLRLAHTQGVKTLNGASMLFFQAYYADCLYLDRTPSDDEAAKLYQKYLEE